MNAEAELDDRGFLTRGGGEMGARIRAHEWSRTPLGPPETWPQSLKMTVSIMVGANSPMAIYWGPDLILLYNDRWRALIGGRHPSALGRSAREVFPEVWETIGPRFADAMAGKAGGEERDHLLPLDRHGRVEDAWFDYSFNPIPLEGGSVGGILSLAFETTRRVVAERELRANEARQAFLLAVSDRLRPLAEPRAIIAAAAQALGEHLGVGCVGYSEADASGERVTIERDWTAPGAVSVAGVHRLDSYGPAMIAELRAGRTVRVGDVARSPMTEGMTSAYAAIRTRAFVDAPLVKTDRLAAILFVLSEEPRAWTDAEVALIEAIAERTWAAVERARSEAALREANETLEQRVAAALTGREDIEGVHRQSQKMEAVGQLTGGIAHDFNNMLQAIGGSLELARRRVEQGRAEEVVRYVEAARRTVERGAALTHRLLAFARRQALQPRAIEPDALVEGMAELIRRTVGPGVTVESRLRDGVWSVLCDPNQLENVLLNLAINARDAMPEGGRLTIGTEDVSLGEADIAGLEGARASDYVEIAVADTGMGMDEAIQAHAFEPFFTTKPLGQGTGLGLSQVYGFVRQSGGFVRLASAPGRGTTVRLYLPRHERAQGQQPQLPAAEPEGTGAGEAVLLVEDEAGVRELVAERLRELGYRVLEAADGPAALRLLRSGARVDVLVTDVGLPGGLNGRQVADVARERRPDLPVLFITGYAAVTLAHGAALDPGMEMMTKPFALDALATRIRDLKRSPAPSSASSV